VLIILFKQFDLFDPNIDIFTQKFTDTLSSIINKYVPSKLVRINPSDKPWVNRDIKQLIRARKRAYRKARSTNTKLIGHVLGG